MDNALRLHKHLKDILSMSSQFFPDITIQFGEKKIYSHKCILARNPMLREILTENTGNLNIMEVSEEVFRIFLKYLYTNELEDDDITESLLFTAKYYEDKELEFICENAFTSRMKPANVLELAQMAVKHDCYRLKQEVAYFIVKHYDSLSKYQEFDKILNNKKLVSLILKSFNRVIRDVGKEAEEFILFHFYIAKSDVLIGQPPKHVMFRGNRIEIEALTHFWTSESKNVGFKISKKCIALFELVSHTMQDDTRMYGEIEKDEWMTGTEPCFISLDNYLTEETHRSNYLKANNFTIRIVLRSFRAEKEFLKSIGQYPPKNLVPKLEL